MSRFPSRLVLVAAAVIGAALARPAQAQNSGTIDLGALARYSVYDEDLNLDDAWGPGGRLGYYFSDHWAIEADAGFTATQAGAASVDHTLAHVRLIRSVGLGKRFDLLLGAGYAYNKFSNGTSESEHGAGGLAGLRLRLFEHIGLRADATADYMLDQAIAPDDNIHLGAQAGVSLLLGGGPGDDDKDGVLDDTDACPDTPAATPGDTRGCTDSDRDGVADQGDRCPNTPSGRPVDALGCTDVDGDGVVDPQDGCANTPAGVRVDASGCPLDADRDGVSDAADRCPSTPAGARVDANGCPLDSDADGVPDTADRCPGTAAGVVVDAAGCPPPVAPAPVVLEGVNFLSGSSKLTLDSQGPLNRVVEALNRNAEVRVAIEGHTDNVGNRESNIRLSRARAQSVRAYLISKGIAASRLTAEGLGPDQPIASNDTPEGRTQNRRVQLRQLP
ncbi:MAG: OmpA family protein [Acidimicrobiales bacterium]